MSRRAATEVQKLTLFSSEGILSCGVGGRGGEQDAFGNFRSVSSGSTKNVLRTIICGLHSPPSVELNTKPGVSTRASMLKSIDRISLFRTEISLVTVHPVALFSILDHYLRRKDEQARVIGTLLGTVSDSGEVEVRSSFAVPHSESEQQVAIDGDHHRTMYELHHKINPKEVVVGWYVRSLQTVSFLF